MGDTLVIYGITSDRCHDIQRDHLSLASATRPNFTFARFSHVKWARGQDGWVETGDVLLDDPEYVNLSKTMGTGAIYLSSRPYPEDDVEFEGDDNGSDVTDDENNGTIDNKVPDVALEVDDISNGNKSTASSYCTCTETFKVYHPDYVTQYCNPPLPDFYLPNF